MAAPEQQAGGSNASGTDAPPTEPRQARANSADSSGPPQTGHQQADGRSMSDSDPPPPNDSLKDTIIEYLSHRSEFRWNILTALMLLVTVLYLITVGVEFYRKGQVEDALREVTAARDELRSETSARAARIEQYSNILKDVLLSDFDVDEGIRGFDKQQYQNADRHLSRGIDRLESTLTSLSGQSLDQRMQAFSFDSETCTMHQNEAAAKRNVADDSASSLIPILKDRLAIAYQDRILQHYLRQSKPKGWEQSVRRDAYAAATLDSGAVGIFHWLGVAETGIRDFDHAERCFKKSVHQSEPHGIDDLVSVDYINLAELAFFKGRCCYGEVEQLAGRFLSSERDMESSVDVARSTVAGFYRAAARYLQSGGEADSRSTELKEFCNEVRNKKVKLLGRFSSNELDEYINRPPPEKDISKEQLTDVKAAIECLE
jgi:hypothetical protein